MRYAIVIEKADANSCERFAAWVIDSVIAAVPSP